MLKPIFSSFIHIESLTVDNLYLIQKCQDLEKITPTVYATNEGGWQSPLTNYIPGFEDLISAIEEKCNNLHKQLGYRSNLKQEIDSFWININRDKDSNYPHTHPNSILSGVYYIKAEPNAGSIIFMHPVATHQYHAPYGVNESENMFNVSSYSEYPEPGKLIIFPSYLMHYVQPNRSGSSRISLAFNTSFKDN